MKKAVLSVALLLGLVVVTFHSYAPIQLDLADHGSEYTGR